MGQPDFYMRTRNTPRMALLALIGLAIALTGAVLVARPLLVWPTEGDQSSEQGPAEKRTQTRGVGLICLGIGLWVLREGLPAPG